MHATWSAELYVYVCVGHQPTNLVLKYKPGFNHEYLEFINPLPRPLQIMYCAYNKTRTMASTMVHRYYL